MQTNPVSGGSLAMVYVYDAEGNRVAKVNIQPVANPPTGLSCDPAQSGAQLKQSYILGPQGQERTMLNGSGVWQWTNVYAGSALVATYDTVGLHFQFTDALGTRRVQTDSQGTAETLFSSLPYGDDLTQSSPSNPPATADDATPLHFTGKERDAESGNDYFGARYYASTMGRFLSPDPSVLDYADPTNPQSLNLYSYVYNNPLTDIDPSGMDACAYDNGDGTSTIVNASDGGAVDCPGNGFYITTTQQVTAVGYDSNGNLSVYGADGSLYNPDGSDFSASQTVTVNGDDNSDSYIGPQSISSGLQFITSTPTQFNWTGTESPNYTLSQVCGASALLHGGTAFGLDAVGMIPFTGTAFSAVKNAAAFLSAGVSVGAGSGGSLADPALSASSAGLATVDVGHALEAGSKAAEALPVVGNAVSVFATYRDWKAMQAYYNNCLAGNN